MTRQVAKAALAVAILAVVLELTARWFLFGIGGIDPLRIALLPAPTELVTFETLPSIVFEYKPGLDRQQLMNRFHTNSWGMRDREYPLAKPRGTFRVAVIGSSFTVPAGVEIEDAFHSLLEERLSAEFDPVRHEFLNFAVGLHLPSQYVAMVENRALRFDPDLIMVSVSPPSVPFFLKNWSRPVRPGVLDGLPSRFRSLFIALVKSRLGIDRRSIQTPISLFPGPAVTVVEKLGEIRRETGIPVVVARLELSAKPEEPVEQRLEAEVRSNGMFYVDARQAFAGEDPREFWVHELDPHPNAAAHALFADVIGDFLRRENLLSARAQAGQVSSQRATARGVASPASPRGVRYPSRSSRAASPARRAAREHQRLLDVAERA